MSATITWRVGTMECYPQYQQEKDVVFTVHWDCVGSEDYNGNTYRGRVYGSTSVTYHGGDEFIPYQDLTEPTVLGWVWTSMGEEQKLTNELLLKFKLHKSFDLFDQNNIDRFMEKNNE